MPGFSIIYGQHKCKIKGNRALKFIQHRMQQFRISEAGNEYFKNLFNGLKVHRVAFVLLEQAQIFIGKSGIAQKGC